MDGDQGNKKPVHRLALNDVGAVVDARRVMSRLRPAFDADNVISMPGHFGPVLEPPTLVQFSIYLDTERPARQAGPTPSVPSC